MVYNVLHTFCADLSDDAIPGLAGFAQAEDLKEDEIYMWIEIQYRTREHADLPQYHHAFVGLASISTYASWTRDERELARKTLYEQERREFEKRHTGRQWAV
jgi:hypothetical protein